MCRLMQSCSAHADATLAAVLQTAHEPSYLVKHLLGSLPPVVERVKLMRKGQAPNGSSEDNLVKMAQSQVRHFPQFPAAFYRLPYFKPCEAGSAHHAPSATALVLQDFGCLLSYAAHTLCRTNTSYAWYTPTTCLSTTAPAC